MIVGLDIIVHKFRGTAHGESRVGKKFFGCRSRFMAAAPIFN